MKMKTVSLLLVCLVTLSIVYAYGSAALSYNTTQPINDAPSKLLTVIEEASRYTNLPAIQLIPLGDPIDDPIPHTY